jgi:hypothetical protein
VHLVRYLEDGIGRDGGVGGWCSQGEKVTIMLHVYRAMELFVSKYFFLGASVYNSPVFY